MVSIKEMGTVQMTFPPFLSPHLSIEPSPQLGRGLETGQFPLDLQQIAGHHRCLVALWGLYGDKCSIMCTTGCLQNLCFHSCCKSGSVRPLKHQGIDCLAHTPLCKNLLYFYIFPETPFFRKSSFILQTSLQDRMIHSTREQVP